MYRLDYVDSARRFSARRQAASNNGGVGWGKTSYFVSKCVNISKTVGDTFKVTIYD